MFEIDIKLKQILYDHDLTVTTLSNASGISKQTLYSFTRKYNKPNGIKFETLEKIVTALEQLTGKVLEPNDLLTFKRS